GDASAADFSLQRAAVARAQAERADPEHTDRAWDHSGVVMMAAEVTHGDLHDDLLEFYAQQLKLEVEAMARTPADVRDSITEAIEWLKFALRVYEKQIKRESEDLEFQVAEGAWPDDVKAMRGAQPAIGTLPALPSRPMISVATLDEPVALVSAEERKAHLGV